MNNESTPESHATGIRTIPLEQSAAGLPAKEIEQSAAGLPAKEIEQSAVTRAVLIAIPSNSELPASCLTPLVDRPMVQHVIERLCAEGIRWVDVLGLEDDILLRDFVCDDDRWGARFRWHATKGERCDALRGCGGEDRIVLASAHCLPLHPLSDPALHEGIVSRLRGAGSAQPIGWSLVDAQVLDALPLDCDLANLSQWLDMLEESFVSVARTLQTGSYPELLKSQRRLLTHANQPLSDADAEIRLIGRETAPGVRVCRNVKMHRSVQIEGPVFIGDNSRIGKGAKLGPNTVIGPNCIVDHHASLANSLLTEKTYVGPWVELHDCVAEQTRVTNLRLQVAVSIDDPLILSPV